MNLRLNKTVVRILPVVVMLALLAIGLGISSCTATGAVAKGWSGAVVSGNSILVASMEGKLISLDATTRNRQWPDVPFTTKTSGGFGFGLSCGEQTLGTAIYGTPAVWQDLIFVGGYDGKVYAIAASTGRERWVYPRQGTLQPIVGGLLADSNTVYFGDSNGKVFALDAATGDLKWEFTTGGNIWSTPAVDSGTLYIGSFDQRLYALNAATGAKKWEFATAGAVISSPVVSGGTVYFGSFDTRLYAVNAADGALKWQSPEAGNWFWARPVISGNAIYAPSLDGKVYVYTLDKGTEVAQFDLGKAISASLAVSDGNVIAATEAGQVYSLGTGNQKTLITDLKQTINAPLAVNGGNVYIHTERDMLYAVNVQSGTPLWNLDLKAK